MCLLQQLYFNAVWSREGVLKPYCLDVTVPIALPGCDRQRTSLHICQVFGAAS